MYVIFRSIGRSTILNIPVYEYVMSFQLLVSSFFRKCSMIFSAQIFHFLSGHLCCLPWDVQSQGWEKWAHEDSDCPFPPLCTYSLVTCNTGIQGHALLLCLQVSHLLRIFFDLSVHLTIGMFTSTLPMSGLGSRTPGMPTHE